MSEKMREKMSEKKGKKLADLMERLAAMEERVEEAERRLDKQETAIKGYRERVKALEQRECCAGGAGTAGGEAVTEVPDQGWAMKPECLTCGAGKEPGREKRLTCEPCGKRYYEQSRKEYEGERTLYSRCLSCGKEKKSPGPAMQCAKCSAAFKEWKTRA